MKIIYRAADIGTVVRIRAEINGIIFYSKEEFDTLDAAREYIAKHLPAESRANAQNAIQAARTAIE